ncbi:MAG: spondin domain-containing protein [Pseudomonadota bacterium]
MPRANSSKALAEEATERTGTRRAAALLLCATLGATAPAGAVDFSVQITNLTNGITFTPFLVAAHPAGTSLFAAGEAASPELQAMAEGGAIDGLVGILNGIDATIVENPAGGLLGPTASTTASLNTDDSDNVLLSVVAMLLPTNDAFAGLNSIEIPTEAGTYVYNLPAYDAGTEANDEIVNGGGAPGVPGIPAAPGGSGTGAFGVTGADTNTTVHIHRGTVGDTDTSGGPSDLDVNVHRWLNPVVRVTLTVN